MVKFTKVKAVTRPLFKMVNGKERFYKIDSPMFVGREMKAAEGATQKKGPAMLCFVTDLETGEEGQIILGKVLQDILNEQYPDNSYVGHAFSIIQNKVDGKGYNVYVVSEVVIENEEPVADDSSLPPQTAKTDTIEEVAPELSNNIPVIPEIEPSEKKKGRK